MLPPSKEAKAAYWSEFGKDDNGEPLTGLFDEGVDLLTFDEFEELNHSLRGVSGPDDANPLIQKAVAECMMRSTDADRTETWEDRLAQQSAKIRIPSRFGKAP